MPSTAELLSLGQSRELVGYFGYGSLVNRDTLRTAFIAAWPARLNGWRRTWRSPPDVGRDLDALPSTGQGACITPALLSAHPAAGRAIDGLLVLDFAENMPAVDLREIHYHRRDISLGDLEFAAAHSEAADLIAQLGINLHVYEARHELPAIVSEPLILRSYLDAVMAGFLREFGEDGVTRFVSETDDFHTSLHEDRHAPSYPRSVTISDAEIDVFAAALAARAGNTPD